MGKRRVLAMTMAVAHMVVGTLSVVDVVVVCFW